MKDKISGVLYGMAIGDAMGMPPELWSRKRIIEKYGTITDFLEGDPENEISFQYKRGNFTDDTSQAITILDSLIETDFEVDSSNIAKHILAWAKKENAFENNILGPTSKITLELFEKGENAKEYSDQALSNGAAMRIPPIGTLFTTSQKKELCDYVKKISEITHSSDITLAGASIIATAVASAMEKEDRDAMIQDVLDMEEYAMSLGASTVSASLGTRVRYPVLHLNDKEALDFTRKDTIEDAAKELYEKNQNKVIVTLGSKGVYLQGEAGTLIPTQKVNAIDTIGAGDSHIGAIIAMRQKGAGFEEAIATANKVSGLVVGVQGPTLTTEEFHKGGF